jgi:hypothetical protein
MLSSLTLFLAGPSFHLRLVRALRDASAGPGREPSAIVYVLVLAAVSSRQSGTIRAAAEQFAARREKPSRRGRGEALGPALAHGGTAFTGAAHGVWWMWWMVLGLGFGIVVLGLLSTGRRPRGTAARAAALFESLDTGARGGRPSHGAVLRARQVTRPVRNREARVTGPQLA